MTRRGAWRACRGTITSHSGRKSKRASAEEPQIEVNDEVVNIIPVKGRDERFERLLGLRIKRFILEAGKTVEDITKTLQSLPEFASFTQANKLQFTGYREGTNFIVRAQYGRVVGEKMDFSDLTFRDLLNRITKVKRGGWSLKWKWISKTTREEHIDIDI